ncbi:hypothetical protein ILUMI_11975 [Ignelater luminosus]|uniref:Uncharacterized protein n=1 Tax=Ignelater luminosus TaxID=2038154 RepID=A0A8K0CV42_IGNLU|nr:hypothetical protein ILUMI_11975 [Ignelater luminosus]
MKFKIAIVLGLACLIVVCSARPAEDYEYDDAGAAPAKPASRSNPLLNRRNPLSRGGAAKSTTTTTAAPEEEEEEELPEEELVEEEIPAETTSTTESGRKLKGGIVRPFRSNQDLLATLKKRREQAVSNKAQAKAAGHEPQESAPIASESEKPKSRPSSSGGRGRFNKKETAASNTDDQEPSSTAASRTSGRRFRN